MQTTKAPLRLPGTPPAWVNGAMSLLLRLPGLRRILGRSFGLITVTGWRSGRTYTTPIQHLPYEGELIVLSQRHRRWWRNIPHQPTVRLSVGAKPQMGVARLADDAEAREILATCLAQNPRVAGFYGITVDQMGEPPAADVDALLERLVVIAIRPADRRTPAHRRM